jgi:ATP:ADP antiporter, AAA family
MSTEARGSAGTPEFSRLRSMLWPIHSYEMKKFVPLALIMCLILFVYTTSRNIKDTLIVSSAGAGAITFLKLYCVMPSAMLFFILYTKLVNAFDLEKVFYLLVTPFLVFFALFASVLNPNLDSIQPSAEAIMQLKANYPALQGFFSIYGNWVYSLFFVIAELWGSVVLSLAFWQFANQITRMKEAKRFYGLFVVISNVSLMLSGQAVDFFSEGIKKYLPEGANCWQWTLSILMTIVVVMGLLAMATYRWMHVAVLTDPKYYEPAPEKKEKKSKPGLIESVKLVFSSRELGLIVLLVISYGITINLVEVQWKNQVGIYFNNDKSLINSFMGQYSFWTGVVTVFFAWFIGSNVLRNFGWFISAAFTPVVIMVCGIIFFLTILNKEKISSLLQSTSLMASPAAMAVFVGAVIVILSKASKYSLFDPTKEMAYIPLDQQIRTKGKAAVDVVGGRLGKSGGAFAQSSLLMILGTTNVLDIASISVVVFCIICVTWLGAAKALSRRLE